MQPTIGALLHSLSPVVTVLLAAAFFGERFTATTVVGFLLGVAGVFVVLGPDVAGAGGVVGFGLGVAAMLCLCLGWLGQRVADPSVSIPVEWNLVLQFAAPLLVLVPAVAVVEGFTAVTDAATFTWSVLYLAVVNSILGVFLIQALVRRGGAGATSSVFFLMPAVTAGLSYLAFADTLTVRDAAGLLLSLVGVGLATRRRRAPNPLGRTPEAS